MNLPRHVLEHEDANSTEFDRNTSAPVIDLMIDQRSISDMGGTMRLGLYPCVLQSRHQGRRGLRRLEQSRNGIAIASSSTIPTGRNLNSTGMVFSGMSPDGKLVEIAELADHPYMVGSQFHPEFLSRPMKPHPLFLGLIKAAKEKAHNQ